MSELRLAVTCEQDVGETSSSSICRAYLAIDTLRENKWAAGSWALITRFEDSEESPEVRLMNVIPAFARPDLALAIWNYRDSVLSLSFGHLSRSILMVSYQLPSSCHID